MTTRFNPGDIVRLAQHISLSNLNAPRPKIGDVFEITRTPGRYSAETLRHDNGQAYPGGGWGDDRFELIARAGEPVRYQPGDVVELIEDDGPERKGERFTVREQTSPARGGITPQGYLWYSARSCIRAHRCKLVHRPAKTEPLVFTPPEPQVGDRVRVTVEGKVRKAHDHGGLNVVLDGGPFSTPFSAKELAEGKVEVIERAEKPLAVGDRVRSYRAEFATGEIIGLRGDKAWVEVNPDRTYTTFTSNLERVS